MRSSLLLLSALSFSPLSAQTLRVDPKPVTSIGSSDMSGSELLKVTSARRLPDGRIVVTNGEPREVRVFGKDGKLLSRFGKAGQGPGEFGYAIDLVQTRGDSIVIWDRGNRRTLTYQADGKLLSEVADPTGQGVVGQMAVVRRTLARTRPNGDNACVMQAIAALPPSPPRTIRELFLDEAGRAWARENGKGAWALTTIDGRPLGTIALPAGLEVFQAGKDFVLGRTIDEDGFDHLVVLHVTLPTVPGQQKGCATPAPTANPLSEATVSAIKMDMRNLLSVFEFVHRKNKAYPTSLEALNFKTSPDHDGEIVIGPGAAGYFTVAIFDRKTTYACVVAMGTGIPAGWQNGYIMCGW